MKIELFANLTDGPSLVTLSIYLEFLVSAHEEPDSITEPTWQTLSTQTLSACMSLVHISSPTHGQLGLRVIILATPLHSVVL